MNKNLKNFIAYNIYEDIKNDENNYKIKNKVIKSYESDEKGIIKSILSQCDTLPVKIIVLCSYIFVVALFLFFVIGILYAVFIH